MFDFSDNTLFIKPFAGVNYYFSYTPSHTENGAIAKDIDSMKNNSVSIEVGAEFRKYMNENSYIYEWKLLYFCNSKNRTICYQ